MLDDKIIIRHIAQASELICTSLPEEAHAFSPEAEKKAVQLLGKYKWFEWRQAAKQPAKRLAAAAMVFLVFGFSGIMTVQANRRRAVETIVRVFEHYISSKDGMETPPPENPVIYTIEFGWLPDRMYETERIESEDFYYILFQTQDPDYPLEDQYVAFFLKKLPPTGSDKIVGSRIETKDLQQEALMQGAEVLAGIIDVPHNMSGWSTTRTMENGERCVLYIQTNAEAGFSKGGNVLQQIHDNLIIHEEGGVE